MPNVQGTPMTGTFVGQPQGNPLADALGALATSYAAKQKYQMDQQNSLRNAVAPQLIAAGYQPEGGFNFDMGMGSGSRPWAVSSTGKAALEGQKTLQDIEESKAKTEEYKQNVKNWGVPKMSSIMDVVSKQYMENQSYQTGKQKPMGIEEVVQNLQAIQQKIAAAQGGGTTQAAATQASKVVPESQLKAYINKKGMLTGPQYAAARAKLVAALAAKGYTVGQDGTVTE